MDKTLVKKESIIAEYLAGEITFRQLATRHGINLWKIHYWVSTYQGKVKPKTKVSTKELKAKVEVLPLPTDVK